MHTTIYDNYSPGASRDIGTFVPTKGTKKVRLDYISSTGNITCMPGSVHVDDSLSRNGTSKKDHRPLF